MKLGEPLIPAVGVVHGMSNADYHAHASLSKSQLADFLVCPANYYGLHLAPSRPLRAETAGQRTGTLTHTLVLEPDTFDARYRIGPDAARSTKAWKDWAAQQPADVALLKPDEYASSLAQAASLRAHAEVGELLANGVAEASVFWRDAHTGVALRCRPDWLHDTPEGWIVLDIKTGRPDPFDFARQCAQLTYHLQHALYCAGIEAATGRPVIAFLFGVVAVDAPYLSSCVMLDDDSIAAGRRLYRDTLDRFARCQAANHWPGYEGVQLARLPAYALAQQE